MTGLVTKSAALLAATLAVGLILTGAAISKTTARAPLTVVVIGKGATVNSIPAGISCPRKCTASFAAGARVVLSPHSSSGVRLVRWAGGCTGSGACKVKVSAPTAVTAVFGAASKAATKPGASTSAEPGYYSDGYVKFFVSPTGKTVQNFTSYVVNIMCTSPVTGAPGQVQGFAIPVAAIKPDGSISGSITQSGAFAGLAATITYSVSGHMAKATATAAASGTGTYREDIVLKDSSKRTCTSNNQPWTVPKAGPIPQAKSMLAAGKYSDGYFTLSVSGSKVLDLTNYVVNITCLPAVTGAPGQVQGFAIPEATINADGSFTGKATQSGVFAGSPATITYSAAGNFQGLSSNGPLTAAGTYREDIVLTDSAGTHTCTSNTLPWFVAHK